MKKFLSYLAMLLFVTLAMPALAFAESNVANNEMVQQNFEQLGKPHNQYFYLCTRTVKVDLLKQMDKAHNLIVTGQDLGLAKAILDEVIKLDGQISEAYLLRALCLTELNKFRDAEEDYKQALMLEPENPTFYYYRGLNNLHWYKSRGWSEDRADAINQFGKALEIVPYYLDARVGVGDVYMASNEYEKAIEQYNKVLALFPEHGTVLAKKTDAQRIIEARIAKQKREVEERERERKLRERIG